MGAVENANEWLRRYSPFDVLGERLTADSLEALANGFNATPHRCLCYRTPAYMFEGRLDPSLTKRDTAYGHVAFGMETARDMQLSPLC